MLYEYFFSQFTINATVTVLQKKLLLKLLLVKVKLEKVNYIFRVEH